MPILSYLFLVILQDVTVSSSHIGHFAGTVWPREKYAILVLALDGNFLGWKNSRGPTEALLIGRRMTDQTSVKCTCSFMSTPLMRVKWTTFQKFWRDWGLAQLWSCTCLLSARPKRCGRHQVPARRINLCSKSEAKKSCFQIILHNIAQDTEDTEAEEVIEVAHLGCGKGARC